MDKQQEILKQLKTLANEGRAHLAEIRRRKRESRPPKSPSRKMHDFIKARQSVPEEVELHMITALLDRDDLTRSERNSLKHRKKVVVSRLTSER
jgi:hypothetical protein